MKKILNVIIISLFVVSAGYFVLQANSKGKTQDREQIQNIDIPVHHSSVSSPLVMTGPDFTSAAEKSIPEITQKTDDLVQKEEAKVEIEYDEKSILSISSKFIRKSSVYNDFFGSLRQFLEGNPFDRGNSFFKAYGSGVIISDDGYIATNNHVVQDAKEIEVTLNDKRTFKAKIVGNDPSTDLALIKIEAEKLPFLIYGNSDEVKVGEWVLAVGNPFNLTSTVTAGIVSAKARDINILGSNSAIESFIQTDAVINRGNSGGALVDINGELVGINAAIASQTGYYEGYSFAIPVNIVKKVMNDFVKYGEIQRAYVGVVIREIDAQFAEENNIDEIKGIYVYSVSENGGAEEAGIKEGDIITKIEDTEINSISQFLEIIGQYRPGNKIGIDVVRKGRDKSFNVTLRNENGDFGIIKSSAEFFVESLGARFEKVSNDEKQYLKINNGLKISKLEDGLLKNGGIREGFIITNINGVQISNKNDINNAINNSRNNIINIEGVYPNGMRIIYGFGM